MKHVPEQEMDATEPLKANAVGGSKWRPLAGFETIWHAETRSQGVLLRSVAVALEDGRLAVYSPIRGLGAEAHAELAAIGRPAALIAPNHYHNLGLGEYATTYPGVQILASTVALPRLADRCRQQVSDVATIQPALPPHTSLLIPPATRNGELWLRLETPADRAWIVGDGFFNLARTPRSAMGLLLLALGISPGLRIGSSFRWLIRDRAAYRRWLLDTLARHPPTVLIPCHGEILRDPALPARLKRLAETRL
jgi:hypothetical protein